ncbi:MAG: alpha-glucan family phosphorylase [Desulfopila sp.]
MTTSASLFYDSMVVTSRFGELFGVSQQVFDEVWQKLCAADGNSVAYISMEIGADPDVYNPVRDKLLLTPQTGGVSDNYRDILAKYLHGYQKIPNYSGGLGVLAGDTLKSYADCRLPVVAVSLLYRSGYFSQIVDSKLGQISQKVIWPPENTPCLFQLRDPEEPDRPLTIEIPFCTTTNQEFILSAQMWMKLEVSHSLDFFVPEILLDFASADTPAIFRTAASQLYNADSSITKAIQRRMLGMGILPALRALGITSRTFHLNEQHGVVLAMQFIAEELHGRMAREHLSTPTPAMIRETAAQVADRLVYTIHTPIKAGHDRFNKTVYREICCQTCQDILDILAVDEEHVNEYNFTNMAMRVNRSANSVSRLHRDVTHWQFPQFAEKISAITNGVHHLTWISDERAAVFDSVEQLANWRSDPGVFANCRSLLTDYDFMASLQNAWQRDNQTLVNYLNTMLQQHRLQMTETWINPPNYFSTLFDDRAIVRSDVFTIGFARRFSTYKRADLIFYDMDTLCRTIVESGRPINFIFAGKAHPSDEPGKKVLKEILYYQEALFSKSEGLASLIFIPNYDMAIAKMLVAGVHAWLNCPKRPLEASGTSGMKAAMNGVPNISIMDGWWAEGYHDGATGWKFGHEGPIDSASLNESREQLLYFEDSSSFYRLLPEVIDMFYNPGKPDRFLQQSIMNLALNIPIFNTNRVAAEYLKRYNLHLPPEHIALMNRYAELYNSDK